MRKRMLYIVWAVLYCACVGLGFINAPQGLVKVLLMAVSIGFFILPFSLAFRAIQEKDRKTLKVLRLVSACELALALILLVLNFLSVYFSAHTGLVLYVLLVMFTAPMVCGQSWFLSLFLWACLFMLTLQKKCPCQK